MIARIGTLAGVALLLFAGRAAAQTLTLDRGQTLEQILANCDRATGLPPGDAPRPSSTPGGKVVINPDWLRRPEANDILAAYPARAAQEHIGGKATVRCQVGVDGRLHDCVVVDETPAAMEFGAAALKVAHGMLFIPRRVDCEPVDGALVTIPVTFGPR